MVWRRDPRYTAAMHWTIRTTLAALLLLGTTRCGEDASGPVCATEADTTAGTMYQVSTFADVGGRTEDLAFDGQGNVYVSLTRKGQIRKITAEGKVSDVASGLASPAGLALAPDGALYVCEYGSAATGGGKLTRVSLAGAKTTVATAAGSKPFRNPNHLAINRQGVVYMSDSSGFVARVQGSKATLLFDARKQTAAASPNGVALSADQRTLYVNDLLAPKSVWKVSLDQQGNLTAVAPLDLEQPLTLADGIALDCRGRLYISHGLTKLSMADPVTGKVQQIYAGADLATPANLAFGHGAGFDVRSGYVAQLGMAGSPTAVKKIYLGFAGQVLPSFGQ